MPADPITSTPETLDPTEAPEHCEFEFNALNRLDLLQGLTSESGYGLLQRCPIKTLHEGESLLTTQGHNRQVYLILSGSLTLTLEGIGDDPIAHLGAGETVGEISAPDQQPATANVRADSDCRLLVVDLPTLWSLVGASHAFALNLILKLVERARGSNAAMHEIARLRAQFERAALYRAKGAERNRCSL
jgi:CRP-like cAMP-binding protein